ncbi:hypothetical protein PoB_003655400 [Plakobranchus ocellatus]|uniref:Alpha/beta hydrolase fold-5 domain-containing protein n=1 Tax=Plakobranchus ocellatus TaxID=259542 RepID=A0AAV4AVB9_9GAST|nr:hypothetical protein PoB_003655400 [Plakobranchus ocellatus]
MHRPLIVLVAFTVCLTGSFALTSEIIQPIRRSGDEVALIFIPGAKIQGEAYRKTAVAIQQATNMAVWAALTGNYTFDIPTFFEMKSAVEGAIDGLKKAGMTSTNYVGVAHSLGGVFLSSYAENSPLKAVILMGSYINRGTKLRDYAKPLLTLSGELDGQTRITRIAADYEQLHQDAKQNKTALYRKPVVNIKGLCHAQFASGPMPPKVIEMDLKPDITETQAHAEIGRYVSHFLAVTFSTVQSEVAEAKMQLDNDFMESGTRFQPLLNMKALDRAGNTCPWAQIVQGYLAGKLVSRTIINNVILGEPKFARSKPSLVRVGNRLVISTTTEVKYEWNIFDVSINKESPREISVKMKSREAIEKALGSYPEAEVLMLNKNSIPTCRFMNEQALNLALKNSTIAAQERYKSRGRPLTFKDDIVYGTGIKWLAAPLALDEDDKGLSVQSVGRYEPMSSAAFPGMYYYCKVLSPYRAMEWINVDSLRVHNVTASHL